MLFLLACTPSEPLSEPVEVVEPADTSASDSSSDSGQDTEESGTDTEESGVDSALDSGGDSADDTGHQDTGTEDTGEWLPAPDAVANWSLPDLNPGSSRFGETISPRDYLSRVSGFYFVRAT